jgi:WD40 repeat protein
MSEDLTTSIVRILTPDGNTAGTGFVVTADGLIATCAHVVWSEDDRKKRLPRPDHVGVVLHATGEERQTQVVSEWWRHPDAEDVAILRLEGDLPKGVMPLPLGSSRGYKGHEIETFGYSRVGPYEESHARGTILGPLQHPGGWEMLEFSSEQIAPGMSGAPVFDVVTRRVVGMVEAFPIWRDGEQVVAGVPFRRHKDTNFAIPTEVLQIVCPALVVSDVCPYRSLDAFTEADAGFFFGRQEVVGRLLESLKREPRFLAVLGPSGSGKSSLVQAGLIPQLRSGAVPRSDRWDVIVTRPADHPFHRLEAQGLTGAGKGLVVAVQAWSDGHPEQVRLVLVVDQFEELLVTNLADLRGAFVAQLTELLEADLAVTVILVMRDDFYGRLGQEAPTLLAWLERGLVNVPPTLSSGELRDIVEKPAGAVGLVFETGLVEAILDDAMESTPKAEGRVGRSTTLPLLEFALAQLWERRLDGVLTHEAYEAIGGVAGGLTQWADRAFHGLEKEERRLACRVLTDLVHLGDESQGLPDSGGRRSFEELCRSEGERETVHQVVRQLADARLLTTGRDLRSGQETVELIHDALLREWGLLQGWLGVDRRFLAWRQALEGRVKMWEGKGRDEGTLLRGALLAEAKDWLERRGAEIAETERDFIEASWEAHQKEQERWKALYEEAERQRQIALARQLAVQAQMVWDNTGTGLVRSVLLAVESLRHHPTLEGDQVLRRGLGLLPRPVTRMVHEGYVGVVAFSPDGRWATSGSGDGTVRVWEVATGREVAQMAHKEPALAVAFSPDGRWVTSGSRDSTVRVWEAATGREVARMAHEDVVNVVAFSPDGQWVASGSDDGTVRVWEAATGREVAQMTHEWPVETVAFSPDGQWVGSGSGDCTARVWEMATGREMARMVHEDPVLAVAFSPDGRWMVSGSMDGTVRVWGAVTWEEVARMTHGGAVLAVTPSPDGRWVASGSDDSTVRVWKVATGWEVARMAHDGDVVAVVFSPDGRWVASGSMDNTVRVWEAATGREVARVVAHEEPVLAVAFSPDGRWVASGSDDHTVRVWEVAIERRVTRTDVGWVYAMAFSPDGQWVASGSMDNTARVWEATTGREVARMEHGDDVRTVIFSSSGQWVASGSDDHTVRVWEAVTGREVARMEHEDLVSAVAFSPDEQWVASGSWDGTVRVWEAVTGREVASIKHEGPVRAIIFSPDGQWVASGSSVVNGLDEVRVWDAATGREVARMEHGSSLETVAFSPDGQWLASGSEGTVRLWEVTTGEEVARTAAHEGWVRAVVFSPNGRWMASGGRDGTVRVWEAATGREAARMVHGDEVNAVFFSPDGRWVKSGSMDGTVRVWLWRPEDLIAEACARLPRNLTPWEWELYIGDEPYRPTCPNLLELEE